MTATGEQSGHKGRGKGNGRPYRKRNLENAALHYLGRYASSEAHLREIMHRKLARARERGRVFDEGEAENWITDIVVKFRRLGYLDDSAYARMRSQALFQRGKGLRAICYDLQQKGLSEEDIDTAMNTLQAEYDDADLEAARRFCRRRRLGPWRRRPLREGDEKRDLAALARNGFSYTIARRVLQTEDPDD